MPHKAYIFLIILSGDIDIGSHVGPSRNMIPTIHNCRIWTYLFQKRN